MARCPQHCTGVEGKESRRLYIWVFSMLVFQENIDCTRHISATACAQDEDALIIVSDRRVIAHWSLVSDMFPGGKIRGNKRMFHRQTDNA